MNGGLGPNALFYSERPSKKSILNKKDLGVSFAHNTCGGTIHTMSKTYVMCPRLIFYIKSRF